MITIIDYGTSNLGSMRNMLRKIGAESIVASTPEAVIDAKKIILPGVGAFDAGMRKLNASGMIPVLNRKVLVEKVPVLGVCLGMQLMTRGSDEGEAQGLGWFPAYATRFDQQAHPELRVPNMGWHVVNANQSNFLIADMPDNARFYFAHSYHIRLDDEREKLLSAHHGPVAFTAAYARENMMGAQFHPEKSHRFGMWFLRNFVERV